MVDRFCLRSECPRVFLCSFVRCPRSFLWSRLKIDLNSYLCKLRFLGWLEQFVPELAVKRVAVAVLPGDCQA